MPCYHPLQAWRVGSRPPVFTLPVGRAKSLLLPCGRCTGCRLDRAQDWAMRCVHEAALYADNCFVTLTYDSAHLPSGMSLKPCDVSLFVKRLRRAIAPARVRFYLCGEYGDRYSRPHYHACLFGFSPADRVFLKTGKDGSLLYRSAMLTKIWGLGAVTVGAVTFDSAGYCARYVMKKQLGADVGAKCEILDVETGEILEREHEFARMSLKPGIGAGWLEKWYRDVYPSDEVIMKGRAIKPPRYYDVLLSRTDDAELLDYLKVERRKAADLHFDDSLPRRLRARERVAKAKLELSKRDFD